MTIVLDLDGTLISCEPRQSAVLQAALASRSVQADCTEIWRLKREGASTLQALLQTGMPSTAAESVAADWLQAIEQPGWLFLDSVFPGVFETLRKMRQEGAELWLLTARGRAEWVPQQLARLGLDALLDRVTVVPSRETSAAKAEVLRSGQVTAFLGDTESDGCAAAWAGVRFLAVSSGQRSAAFLEKAGFGPVFSDLASAWSNVAASTREIRH